MTKTRRFKRLTQSETERLRREVEQMWSTVPPHALARARELAGVQPGKEHEFRIALVREQEDICFLKCSGGVNLRAGLADGLVKGEKAKLLNLQLQCGDRAWQINNGIYANRFQSSEHLRKFLASIEKHVQLYLLERLRDTCIYVWDEAVAKASDDHGLRKIDLTEFADAQIKELRKDKSKALSIRRGAKTGSKQSKARLSKRQVEIDLPKFIRENGEDTTRKRAAQRFGLANDKALDRALAQHGKGWRKLKVEAMMETKKGH